MHTFKNLAIGLLLAVISMFIVFGLFEIYVRVTQADGKNFDIEMWRYAREVKRVSAIPGMGHEHIPGRSGVYMGVPVEINSVGWRDKEYDVQKPEETIRLFMLGDSVTFGWGAPIDGVTSTVLESMLNEAHASPRYEVLNTGIGNTNTAMQTAYFTHEGFRYDPDIVVLNYFINDAEPTPHRAENFFVEHSYAAVFLAGRLDIFMRGYLGRGDWLSYYRNLYSEKTAGWIATQRALRQLVEFCSEKSIHLLIVNYPELHQVSPYPFPQVTNFIKAQAGHLGVPFVDLLPAVQHEVPRSLWVTPTDAHPNGKAGRLFAKRLQAALAQHFPHYFP